MSVLLIDDDPGIRKMLERELGRRGLEIETAATGAEGLARLDRSPCEVVVCDVRLPDLDGLEVLRRIRDRDPDTTEVIVLTGHGTIDSAIEAIKCGAYHYLTKPVKVAELAALIQNAAERAGLRRENVLLRREVATNRRASAIEAVSEGPVLGESKAWQKAWKLVQKAGPTESTVLILGRSGTGKEMVARGIHRLSPRHKRPFVPVNCASVTTSLLESELFGHEAGAFTSAQKRRRGLFELAHGGTLFLDEIAETTPEFQAKLLRVIETGEYRRVGGDVNLVADVRLIAATNRNLKKEVEEGRFREDLYYRLNVVEVELPELKDREGDVEMLARHFLQEYAPGLDFSPEALEVLAAYPWPGNVRELRNVIERISILAEGHQVGPDDIPGDVRAGAEARGAAPEPPSTDQNSSTPAEGLRPPSLAEIERRHIESVLSFTGGNKARAARILGITAATLYNKLKAYKAQDAELKPEGGAPAPTQ